VDAGSPAAAASSCLDVAAVGRPALDVLVRCRTQLLHSAGVAPIFRVFFGPRADVQFWLSTLPPQPALKLLSSLGKQLYSRRIFGLVAPNPTYTVFALSLSSADNLALNWGAIAGSDTCADVIKDVKG
jgi:hypothetical protein